MAIEKINCRLKILMINGDSWSFNCEKTFDDFIEYLNYGDAHFLIINAERQVALNIDHIISVEETE